MNLVSEYLNDGDIIQLSDTLHEKHVSENDRFTGICSGDLIEHVVVRKKIEGSPTAVSFPDGSSVLGIRPNTRVVGISFVWIAIPTFLYGDTE